MPSSSLSSRIPFTVLLAGGQGTRLQELTSRICKPALPFVGARLVDFTLANIQRSQLVQVLVATQYRPQVLHDHLMHCWGDRLHLALRNGNDLGPSGYRGTADAVRANLQEILSSGAQEILILAADHVYQMDYRPIVEFHRECGAGVTVGALHVPLAEAASFGVLQAGPNGRVTDFVEKPRFAKQALGAADHALASLGIYVFDRDYLMALLADQSLQDFGHDLLPQAVAEGRAFAWQADKGHAGAFYWRDVGTLQSYRLAALDHLDPDHAPVTPPIAHRPSRMARWAAQNGSVLMAGAAVSTQSRLNKVILGPDAVVPIGLHLGLDPEEDARHFRLCPDSGTLLVTREMLHAHALSRRPIYPMAAVMPPALAMARARANLD